MERAFGWCEAWLSVDGFGLTPRWGPHHRAVIGPIMAPIMAQLLSRSLASPGRAKPGTKAYTNALRRKLPGVEACLALFEGMPWNTAFDRAGPLSSPLSSDGAQLLHPTDPDVIEHFCQWVTADCALFPDQSSMDGSIQIAQHLYNLRKFLLAAPAGDAPLCCQHLHASFFVSKQSFPDMVNIPVVLKLEHKAAPNTAPAAALRPVNPPQSHPPHFQCALQVTHPDGASGWSFITCPQWRGTYYGAPFAPYGLPPIPVTRKVVSAPAALYRIHTKEDKVHSLWLMSNTRESGMIGIYLRAGGELE
eukprot:gene3143-3677_t